MSKRPLVIWAVALLYIAVGSAGFVAHWTDLRSATALRYDGVLIEVTELVALAAGVFMLRAQNWARWLAVAWMAFHVVLSGFDAFRGFLVHCILCVVIAWAVFRPESTRYFRGRRATSVPTG